MNEEIARVILKAQLVQHQRNQKIARATRDGGMTVDGAPNVGRRLGNRQWWIGGEIGGNYGVCGGLG